MKKTTITFAVTALLMFNGLRAQTVQEGVNHLYADRVKSAIGVFQKMLDVNPNNIEAIYWLGQAYLENEEIASSRVAAARKLYTDGLQASANAPLLLVGLGQVELWEDKTSDARQHFETAITMTHTKKGDDPIILNAIGRANVDAKAGDLPYAIEKLEAAVARDPQNADICLNLGNAYRKAKPGEGGGPAYQNYMKALSINPNFALVYVRLASIFMSQHNYELVLQDLNESVRVDSKFTKGYYELFYFYFFKKQYDDAEVALKGYIASKSADTDIQDQFLYGQLCFVRNDFDCAITKGEAVVASTGANTKPKVYRMLAYSYFGKGDFVNARKYSDEFFSKKNPDDLLSKDYKLRADIMEKTGGNPFDIYSNYTQGALIDTTLADKITFLTQGAESFKAKGDSLSRNLEGDLRLEIIKLKPNPNRTNYFDAALAFFLGKNYARSDSVIQVYNQKWPDDKFGWSLEFNIKRATDTSMALGLAIDPAMKYLDILEKDTTNKKTILQVAGYLAQYYANIAKNRDKAIFYLEKMLVYDPDNADIKKIVEDMKKPPAKTGTTSKGNSPKPAPAPKSKAAVKAPTKQKIPKKL